MKIKEGFVKSHLGDDCIVVPVGAQTVDFRGLITLNETAEFVWDKLAEDHTKEELLDLIIEEYDIDRETAQKDLDELVEILAEKGFVD